MQIDQSKADRKAELALEFARGSRTILECEEMFEGMGPQVRPARHTSAAQALKSTLYRICECARCILQRK